MDKRVQVNYGSEVKTGILLESKAVWETWPNESFANLYMVVRFDDGSFGFPSYHQVKALTPTLPGGGEREPTVNRQELFAIWHAAKTDLFSSFAEEFDKLVKNREHEPVPSEAVQPEPSWLGQELSDASAEVATWPTWMQREAGQPPEPASPGCDHIFFPPSVWPNGAKFRLLCTKCAEPFSAVLRLIPDPKEAHS